MHMHTCNSWLLEFYVLATSKIISGWVLTCDSEHSNSDFIVLPYYGGQATNTMTSYPTQSH